MSDQEEVLSSLEIAESKKIDVPKKLTILPLRDIVIYPNMIFPVLIGRTSSLKAVAEAVERDKFIFVSAQKDPNVDEPEFDDIYRYGTVAKIIQILRLPNNLLKVLIDGLFQAKISRKLKKKEYMEAHIKIIEHDNIENDQKLEAMIRHTSDLFEDYVNNNSHLPPDIISAYENIEDPVKRLFYAGANIQTKVDIKQRLLEITDVKKQYFELSSILSTELELLKLEDEIGTKVHDSIQKTQKKFYIQEQIRALQKELGEEELLSPELSTLHEEIEKAKMPEHAHDKAMEEFNKLKKIPQMSPEFSVNRSFIELLTQVPWNERTEDQLDIEHVKTILDEDHFDLEKPKDRILEYIAVLNLVKNVRRQIICFVGPPGVGKTSLAKSIARALGRKFIRFSLGGVRDEAEIRGHRRTYIGAMPGKIIQSMKKAGTVNPVILLDEIDKMTTDFRGDPSSALLEVLDPEQNINFNDHYLEVDYDLSNVMFITTANVMYDIPEPLRDRMEVIQLSSYLDPDKIEIAKRHLLPKLIKEFGLEEFKIDFKDEALLRLIREYTSESGVRNLERSIGTVLRKLAKDIVVQYDKHRSKKEDEKDIRDALVDNAEFKKYIKRKKFVIDGKKVEEFLKAPKFKNKKDDLQDKVGVANGLAWTSVGGDTLKIEVTMMPGPARLTLTGKLGDVMKESAMAALSFVRSNMKEFGIPKNAFANNEIHVHVPEGAIPKDGPSAGITMAMALISCASKNELCGDVAMTGEITLRGDILAIGGLNEKLLAAKRLGIKRVLIPGENARDVEDVSEIIREGLEIIPVKKAHDALAIAFRNWPPPKPAKKKKKKEEEK